MRLFHLAIVLGAFCLNAYVFFSGYIEWNSILFIAPLGLLLFGLFLVVYAVNKATLVILIISLCAALVSFVLIYYPSINADDPAPGLNQLIALIASFSIQTLLLIFGLFAAQLHKGQIVFAK